MLENFTILTKGGIVLWSVENAKLKGSPINTLIKKVFLEEKSSETSFQIDSYTLKWTFANEFDLIFIAVYQNFITLLFIDELLLVIKKKFTSLYKEILLQMKSSNDLVDTDQFKDFKFQVYLDKVIDRSKVKQSAQKSFGETNKGQLTLETKNEREQKAGTFSKKQKARERAKERAKSKKLNKLNESSSDEEGTDEEEEENDSTNTTSEEEEEKSIEDQMKDLGLDGSPIPFIKKPKKNTENNGGGFKKKNQKEDTKKPKKEMRVWNEINNTVTKKESDKLNRSLNKNPSSPTPVVRETITKMNLDDSDLSDDDISTKDKPVTGFMKYFNRLTGNAVITKEDMEPVLQEFTNHLTKKNVALGISEKLVESIGEGLIGKKLSTFQSINSVVKQTMEDVLTRILTPKKNIDIIRDIQNIKGKRPYTIVFSGVNGVGKSTNLAKVCYWLKSNGFKVLMAACDTFRSGAVEQLKTHADRLGVELFERGYGKDAANTAADAIEYAKSTQHDVVLVDTTGRMQNNEPLMKALSKLVNQNNADLVLFVGEALVGNDGVDQLTKFDKSLSKLASTSSDHVKTIDGIILTKFDTIDDKVGAAISMVYSTGHPILFLGTGQNYTDLKRMNVKSVVKSLLS